MRASIAVVWAGVGFLLALSALNSVASAQVVYSGGFPGNWGVTVAPPVPPDGGSSSGNVTGVSTAAYYDRAAPTGSDLTLLSYQATVTEDHTDPTDAFRFRNTQEQPFTLLEASFIAVPTFLNGTITFGGPPFSDPPPSNLAFGEVTARIDIFDAAGVSKFSFTRHFDRSAPAGPLTVNDFTYGLTSAPLDLGSYRLRATLEIAGHSGSISSLPGASSTVDFFDAPLVFPIKGLAVSIGAYPAGVGNSRAHVKAPEARSTFSVDGTGINVGVLEPGQPYTTHAALPGITVLHPAAPPAGDFRDEHTLAVSSIIAANTGDPTRTGDNGVAPGATLFTASLNEFPSESSAFAALIAKGVNVINVSSSLGAFSTSPATINALVDGNPNLTIVKSSGNNGGPGGNTITNPGMAENIITVGALNRAFTQRRPTSSFSGGALPIKPDIVAPGEYINAAVSRDIGVDGLVDDFTRVFLGDDYWHQGDATTGSINGTSFAAPHVSGAAALLLQYQTDNATHHVQDHRAIKAVLLNGAATGIAHAGGGAWTQARTGAVTPASPMVVTQSLDTELGAGELDVLAALKGFHPDEIHDSHTNALRNFVVNTPLNTTIPFPTTPSGPIVIDGRFWDLETVQPPSGGTSGTVDYLLGDIQHAALRATLTWDNFGGTLEPLELRLYHEGADALNVAGFDSAHPIADALLATTSGIGENVKLFDFTLPDFGASPNAGYYLEVINTGASSAIYGLAVSVPEPQALLLALGALALWFRRGGRR